MIGASDLAAGLRGALRLARFDARGLEQFDNTPRGFWRSFVVALLILPGVLWLSVAGPEQATATDVPAGRFYAILLIQYVVEWTAFPLVMATVCQAIGRDDRFIGFVIAYNWSRVISQPLLLLLIATAGTAPLAALPGFLVAAYVLVFTWFVIRKALDISALGAIGILLLNVVVDLFILSVSQALIQASPA